jgi:hypothetical protein
MTDINIAMFFIQLETGAGFRKRVMERKKLALQFDEENLFEY